jgi:uncharacterized membrane protein (DUF106 family)
MLEKTAHRTRELDTRLHLEREKKEVMLGHQPQLSSMTFQPLYLRLTVTNLPVAFG